MILKRLIEILKSFDKDELKKFGRFIRSDYFNTNERITALFKTLKKFYPHFNDTKLANEYLFRQIFGTRNFDDKTFRYILSELLELAESFLALSSMKEDPVELKKNIIDGLISRRLYSQANIELKALEDKLNKDFAISGTYIRNKMDFSQLWHQLFFLSDKQEPLLNKRIEQGEYLTFHNLAELCHLYQNLNTIKTNYNVEPEDNIMYAFVKNFNYKGMLDYLDNMEGNFEKSKNRQGLINALKIYLCFMITFLDVKDEEYFYKMKELVEKYGKYFDKEELQNLYVMLRSCCNVKRITIDDDKYIRNYFEIVKSGLAKNLVTAYKGQHMDVSNFYRIFQTALYLGEYAWAESFSGKYVALLSPEFRDDFYYYTRAELNFWNNKFEESLGLLSKVKFNFYRLKLNVRMLMLMIYYELGYIEEALSLTDSFAHFLTSNKKLTAEMREQSSNFVFYTGQVLKNKLKPGNKKKIAGLKSNVLNCVQLNNQNWLLKKIEELK